MNHRIESKCFVLILLIHACFPALKAESSHTAIFETIKQEATANELYSLLFALPKGGDLHHHFGGSVPMEFVVDYYRDPEKNGGQTFYVRTRIELCPGELKPGLGGAGEKQYHRTSRFPDVGCIRPRVLFHCLNERDWLTLDDCCQSQFKNVYDLTEDEVAAWISSLKLDEAGEGRDEFFEKTWWRLGPCFSDIEMGPDLLVDNMRAFGQEGIRYLEIQVIPFASKDREGNLIAPEEYYRIYKERLAQPDAIATGVTVRFQIVIIRFLPDAEDAVRRAYAFIDKHRDLFVGINMAGREDNGKGQAARFTEVFREMQRKYPKIPLAIHAGESDEANSNIRDTLLLGVDRIGHGVNVLGDPDTYLLMRNNQYLIEVNLVSNKLLEYTHDYSEHHFPVSLRTGIPVSLNTDDRGMWDSNMTDEYMTAVQQFNLNWEEVSGLAVTSLEHAFLDEETRTKLLASYEKEMLEFKKRFLSENWREALKSVKPIISNYGRNSFELE